MFFVVEPDASELAAAPVAVAAPDLSFGRGEELGSHAATALVVAHPEQVNVAALARYVTRRTCTRCSTGCVTPASNCSPWSPPAQQMPALTVARGSGLATTLLRDGTALVIPALSALPANRRTVPRAGCNGRRRSGPGA